MTQKAHKPTPALRRTVATAAGAGMAHNDVAFALQISRNTLLKYYFKELEHGAFKKRMDVICALHRSAMRGNAAAAKVFLQGTPESARRIAAQAEEPKAKLGKKEQAQREGENAHVGTDWDSLINPKKAN